MFHETNTNERLKNIMLTERSKSKNHQNRTLPHKNEIKKNQEKQRSVNIL